jgi:hypothetical protein
MVTLVADGLSPNAFHEAGFANAMHKEVVIVAREKGTLHSTPPSGTLSNTAPPDRALELGRKRKLKALA